MYALKNYTIWITKDLMVLIHHNRPSQSLIVQPMCQNLQGFPLKSLWRGCYHFLLASAASVRETTRSYFSPHSSRLVCGTNVNKGLVGKMEKEP